ncbi:MAG: hypothetical protein Q9191_004176 [Dirinaria sp. TL-2023a]
MAPIPITIFSGFLGSGKTTLILNLLPQLPEGYRLALLKNEFGDIAIDSQLAASSAIGGVQELLNGCICCNLVGQLGDALEDLRKDVDPSRIIIETSGNAFPATLAMEVNRIGRETGNYVLDGVVVVVDVENWKGYDDIGYAAKMQMKFTDLIVFNKWETVDERRYEDCLDRVGDLELQVATIKSSKGRIDKDILLGLDSALAKNMVIGINDSVPNSHKHNHTTSHESEVEVLSVTLSSQGDSLLGVDLEKLEMFLLSAPKDEIYRIKAIIVASKPPTSSDGNAEAATVPQGQVNAKYVLNWAFGRWTFTPMGPASPEFTIASTAQKDPNTKKPVVRMTVVLARDEAEKWKKRLEAGDLVEQEDLPERGVLRVERLL